MAARAESVCPGCGLTMPVDHDAAYDGYYNASPECWGVYAEVLGAEYGDVALYARVHQLTVDAYAAQHAGGPHPDKSVALHLTGLHLVLERGLRPTRLPGLFRSLADRIETWPHLERPSRVGDSTVLDVALAGSSEEHAERVLDWAREVWEAWSERHPAVAAFASRHLDLE